MFSNNFDMKFNSSIALSINDRTVEVSIFVEMGVSIYKFLVSHRYRSSRNRLRWPKGFWVGLRPRIFLTFGTTRVVGHHPYAPAAFTPGDIPGTCFQRLSQHQGTWFCRWEP